MKKIIAAQQSYAKVNGGMTEVCTLEEIAETALADQRRRRCATATSKSSASTRSCRRCSSTAIR